MFWQVARRKKNDKVVSVERSVIGSGGYGAIFNSQIDPYNEDCYAFACDMGSLYFSYDAGKSFTRHNMQGPLIDLRFDDTTEGVVWAVGSGVYKSVDHGKSFEMVFPKAADITSQGHNYENGNWWMFSENSDYPSQYQVWSVCINRKSGGNNVFVAVRKNPCIFGNEILKCDLGIFAVTGGRSNLFGRPKVVQVG